MPNKNGLVIIQPPSVTTTGTGATATINSNGSVTCSSCVTLNLNNIFTSAYDNYTIVVNGNSSVDYYALQGRYLLDGSNSPVLSDYSQEYLYASDTFIIPSRDTLSYFEMNSLTNTYYSGFIMHVYGPYLNQPTAYRTITMYGGTGAAMYDRAGTNALSTAFSGLQMFISSGTFSGLVAVYGMRN